MFDSFSSALKVDVREKPLICCPFFGIWKSAAEFSFDCLFVSFGCIFLLFLMETYSGASVLPGHSAVSPPHEFKLPAMSL